MAPKRLYPHSSSMTDDGIEFAAVTSDHPQRASTELNSDFPWDEFDSDWYYDHNYKVLREDDLRIIHIVRDFFATLDPSSQRDGIDVGSGTNLYPALTMLPLCRDITLYEYSASNVVWLRREVQCYSSTWDAFWKPLGTEPLYQSINSPRDAFAAVAHVEKGNIFDLPESRWDIGTMFFAAESLSDVPSEFRTALKRFIASLRTGAPFAAAFMENSLGYNIGTHRFPAVAISANDVENCLAADADDFDIHRIGLADKPIRDGYDGMILATGRAA